MQWLWRCVWVGLIVRVADADKMRSLLEEKGAGRGKWEVRKVSRPGFLAVGQQEEEPSAAVEAGFVASDVVLLHLW